MLENSVRDIKAGEYTYKLPREKIAKYPLEERENSKLLVFNKGIITDDTFNNIGKYLKSGITLVFNNTKVIRARLPFRKRTGASIEIFCLEPHIPSDYQLSLSSRKSCSWICLVGNSKKWKNGTITIKFTHKGVKMEVSATRAGKVKDGNVILFNWENNNLTMGEILESGGHVPVPPYLGRGDKEIDNLRYQTVYSRIEGSVAAPTAGFHFTDRLINHLMTSGINREHITLHVGAGTFVPVNSDTIGEHKMHTEHFSVTHSTIKNLLKENVVAVGTTSVRTLESLYWLGVILLESDPLPEHLPEIPQWAPYMKYKRDYSLAESMAALSNYLDIRGESSVSTSTSIIIVPGYKFRIVKGIITNYHMPGSTLLLLVAAFTGDSWHTIYNHALSNGYRFLSYGDSSLLLP